MTGLSPTESIAISTLMAILIAGLGISLVVGVLAIVSPARAITLSQLLSRRHSTRRALKPLELPIVTERVFYRHHRLFGLVIVLGAGLILFYLATRFDARLMAHSLASGHDRIVAEILVDTFVLVMWIGCLFAVAVGTVVLIRPSYLKHFEARANQWLSTRQAAKGMNREVLDVDSLFERYPRLSGVVIALGSLVGLVGLLMLWGRF